MEFLQEIAEIEKMAGGAVMQEATTVKQASTPEDIVDNNRLTFSYSSQGPVILEVDEGQSCLSCNDKCTSGFQPHAWRNLCRTCKCPRVLHDIYHSDFVNIHERLGWKEPEDPSEIVDKENTTEQGYTWIPAGLSRDKVEEFMEQLDNNRIPRINSEGEKYRDIQLVVQLPQQDLCSEYCRHLKSPQQKQAFEEFRHARDAEAMAVATVLSELEEERTCAQCNNFLEAGDVGVGAARISEDSVWHPACFTCSVCEEMLVDLTYCHKDGALFCERHYAELVKPRCAACDEYRGQAGYDPSEVPAHYKYRRGSVTHSWREASLEPIVSHTSEYDELSSEYDTEKATAAISEAYNHTATRYSSPAYAGSSPQHIHTPHEELVPVKADYIEAETASAAYASAPPRPPPRPIPQPRGAPPTSSITPCLDVASSSVCVSSSRSEDHQIAYQNISKKVTQDKDKFWLIFSGEYTKAMDQDWHSGHFCCWNCDLNLTGHRYILREEHPYCIKCYENLFANSCEECKTPIGTDSKDLSYKDKHWHEKCFKCIDCTNSLVDQPFSSRDNKLYCADCHDNNFAARCDGCTNIFRAGMKKFEYKGKQWHEQCFCCSVCKQPIGNKSFIPRDQEVVCVPCYEENFAQRCLKCNGVINKGGITYKGTPWHKDCFTCTNCNKTLSGEKFTSREEKPYCAECFGDLFAKKCIKCTKPITGLGGTKFISFEERHWHSDCFMCYRCNCSLVGRGFLTDGDDILCPECGRA